VRAGDLEQLQQRLLVPVGVRPPQARERCRRELHVGHSREALLASPLRRPPPDMYDNGPRLLDCDRAEMYA
jgi:hypothetical protein